MSHLQREKDRRKREYTFQHTPHPIDRPKCPICGFPMYSKVDAHPQCRVKQEEAQRP